MEQIGRIFIFLEHTNSVSICSMPIKMNNRCQENKCTFLKMELHMLIRRHPGPWHRPPPQVQQSLSILFILLESGSELLCSLNILYLSVVSLSLSPYRFFFKKIELFSLALMLFWVKGSIAQQLLHNTEWCSGQSPNSCVLQSHSCLWIQNWFIWCLEGEKHRLHNILDMPSPLLSEWATSFIVFSWIIM